MGLEIPKPYTGPYKQKDLPFVHDGIKYGENRSCRRSNCPSRATRWVVWPFGSEMGQHIAFCDQHENGSNGYPIQVAPDDEASVWD